MHVGLRSFCKFLSPAPATDTSYEPSVSSDRVMADASTAVLDSARVCFASVLILQHRFLLPLLHLSLCLLLLFSSVAAPVPVSAAPSSIDAAPITVPVVATSAPAAPQVPAVPSTNTNLVPFV